MQQGGHEQRILGEAADLLLRLLASGVVGHQELPKQYIQLVHNCRIYNLSQSQSQSAAFLVLGAAAAAAIASSAALQQHNRDGFIKLKGLGGGFHLADAAHSLSCVSLRTPGRRPVIAQGELHLADGGCFNCWRGETDGRRTLIARSSEHPLRFQCR